jgi:hypothetical protein
MWPPSCARVDSAGRSRLLSSPFALSLGLFGTLRPSKQTLFMSHLQFSGVGMAEHTSSPLPSALHVLLPRGVPGPSFATLRIPAPSTDDLVRAFDPRLGHKAAFMDSFPPLQQTAIRVALTNILKQYTPQSHRRRLSEVPEIAGVDMRAVRDALVATLPWISIKFPRLSADCVRRLLSAPHRGRNSAAAYREEVPAKLVKLRNDLQEDSDLVRPIAHPSC